MEQLATRACTLWNTFWSMGVFTQLASNIKGFAHKFVCKCLRASCVNGPLESIKTNFVFIYEHKQVCIYRVPVFCFWVPKKWKFSQSTSLHLRSHTFYVPRHAWSAWIWTKTSFGSIYPHQKDHHLFTHLSWVHLQGFLTVRHQLFNHFAATSVTLFNSKRGFIN